MNKKHKVYKVKSKYPIDELSLSRFIKYVIKQDVVKCHVAEDDYVFETKTNFIKFISVDECEKDSVRYNLMMGYFSKSDYPKNITDIPELYLNEYFYLNPNEYVVKIENIFILYNISFKSVEVFAGVVMPKYTTLQQCNFTKLHEHEQIKLVKDIIIGVINIHKTGYFHGDLKPLNICLDDMLNPRIIDFGMANKIQAVSAFTNSFGFCSPTQMYYWMTDKDNSVAESGEYECEKFTIIDLLLSHHLIKKNNDGFVVIDNYMKNDFFTIGLLIFFIFGNKRFFFYNDHLTGEKNTTRNFIDCYIKFLTNPKEYFEKVVEEIQLPETMLRYAEFYILGFFPQERNDSTLKSPGF